MSDERIHRISNLDSAKNAPGTRRSARSFRGNGRPPSNSSSAVSLGPIPLGLYLSAAAALWRVEEAREAAGLSLADVAERSGIDKAALSRLENGVHDNPTVETLTRTPPPSASG